MTVILNKTELKKYLEQLYSEYKHKHSSKDPVWALHKLKNKRDIEIAGFIIACFAYGQVDQINKFTGELFSRTGQNIYEFTANFNEQKDKKFLQGLYYRFNNENDVIYLFKNLNKIINEYGSLKKAFLKHYDIKHENILQGLTGLVDELRHYNPSYHSDHSEEIPFGSSRSYFNHLIPSPSDNSTCKRLNLFMRWMVRKDDIDLGIWGNETERSDVPPRRDGIDKSKLIIPVDTHIYKVSQRLKLVKRKSCDLKYAIELTNTLKEFDMKDPVRFDFALCHVRLDKKF